MHRAALHATLNATRHRQRVRLIDRPLRRHRARKLLLLAARGKPLARTRRAAAPQRRPQPAHLRRLPHRDLDGADQQRRLERLDHQPMDSAAHKLLQHLQLALRGHHHHGRRIEVVAKRRNQHVAVLPLHAQVTHDHIQQVRTDEGQRARHISKNCNRMTPATQQKRHQICDQLVIVDDQYPTHACRSLARTTASRRWQS